MAQIKTMPVPIGRSPPRPRRAQRIFPEPSISCVRPLGSTAAALIATNQQRLSADGDAAGEQGDGRDGDHYQDGEFFHKFAFNVSRDCLCAQGP